MKGIRILLINGRELIHRGVQDILTLQEYLVQGMLELEEDMEIVGDLPSAEEALRQPEILAPSIILMEAKMPGMSGAEAARRLRQKWHQCKVIMLTWREECLSEALEAGVTGYFLKDIKTQDLVEVIRRVYHGELIIDERLTSLLGKTKGETIPNNLIKEAELIIPSPVNAARLLSFIHQVEAALETTIVQQVGSWDKGIAFTTLLQRATPLATILNRLGKMADVENVGENSAIEKVPKAPSSFNRQSIARAEIQPRKELVVTLKQDSPPKQVESISRAK